MSHQLDLAARWMHDTNHPLRGPEFSTYDPQDVGWLLTDFTAASTAHHQAHIPTYLRDGVAAELAPALRRVVQSIDPDLPVTDLRTQREQIQAMMFTERAFAEQAHRSAENVNAAILTGAFGDTALPCQDGMVEIVVDVAWDEKVQQAVAIVIAPGCAGGPAAECDASFFCNVRERAIMIVSI